MKPTLNRISPTVVFSLTCSEDGVRAICAALGKMCGPDHISRKEADAGYAIYQLLDQEFHD